MKISRNIAYWAGIIAVHVIVLVGVFTGTYYGTRLPLGTLTQYDAPTQFR
ncbi:MAG TPA: hypothetical protein VLA28_01170 [Afifellaceae bacterium]|nr:hypothetical protein [Afifellaceae bacterium]